MYAALVGRAGVVVPDITVALVVQVHHVFGAVSIVVGDGDDVVVILVLNDNPIVLVAGRPAACDFIVIASLVAGAMKASATDKDARV